MRTTEVLLLLNDRVDIFQTVGPAFAVLRVRLLASGQVGRNALFSLSQSLVAIISIFLVYRLMVAHIGVELFGVWSLLIAGSSLVRIGDISGAGALARFVAIGSRIGETVPACDYVHTVVLTSIGFNVVLGLVIYLVGPMVLPHFIAPQYLAEAETLLPFVVATMVLGGLAVAVTSGIDGTQRADQRAIVVIVAALTFLTASWLLVPSYGIIGYGVALLLQQIIMLGLGWLVLRLHVADIGWLPYRWRRSVFAETTGYALKLNAIGVMGLLFEPLAKFAINHAGGPSLVAYYELASRLVVQIRGLVIAAANPLIPAFAALQCNDYSAIQGMLEKSTRMAMLAAMGVALLALAGAPLMSLMVFGRLEPVVLAMNAALTVGWAINILGVPLYFAAQGQGVLRWNFISHALIALSVLVGVFFLVPAFGSSGLIAAIVAGLVLSTLSVFIGNAHVLDMMDVVRSLRWELMAASLAIAAISAAAMGIFVVATK